MSEEESEEVVEALMLMVARYCTHDGQLDTMRSGTNEYAISVLVKLGRAEWLNQTLGIAKWRKP